jgi:hypothetical protein
MQQLPADVREYLTAGDALGIRAVEEKHPNIRQKLKSPEIRAALFRYLSSDEPWQGDHPGAVISALKVVHSGAAAAEIPLVRPLVMHPEGTVRLQVYQFQMAVYYPDQREPLLALLQAMLLDDHDAVRAQAARYIEGLEAPPELRPFLERWLRLAPGRGWDKHDSFGMIRNLIKR